MPSIAYPRIKGHSRQRLKDKREGTSIKSANSPLIATNTERGTDKRRGHRVEGEDSRIRFWGFLRRCEESQLLYFLALRLTARSGDLPLHLAGRLFSLRTSWVVRRRKNRRGAKINYPVKPLQEKAPIGYFHRAAGHMCGICGLFGGLLLLMPF